MEARPTGILWMTPAWPDQPLGTARRVQKGLLQDHLLNRMREFTLLDDAVQGFGGAAAGRWVGETDRQRQLTGMYDPGGERRRLFGIGEGPAEAVAGAKQERMGTMPEICVNFVSVATGKSLQAPLVTHMSTTCNPRF